MQDQFLTHLFDSRSKSLGITIENDVDFVNRFREKSQIISQLFYEIYGDLESNKQVLNALVDSTIKTYLERSSDLKKRDAKKSKEDFWFLSNQLVGMSLYVDRFAGNIQGMNQRLPYLEDLGVNFLHLLPVFESPENASDGGYAVSDFRKVAKQFGTLSDLKKLQKELLAKEMYLMIDIVVNHTSDQHSWALKAKSGDKKYQDFYYTYPDRNVPDIMEQSMPEVFPESSPGSFTYNKEMEKWVMSVFHSYQWDLNYTNPMVFKEMLDNIFFYANLGVDVLRIDAPAFLWKEVGTSCQNLPKAHSILQLFKAFVSIATPGMGLLGEAIVGPRQIMDYFGKGIYKNQECDVAYNAVQMALQWDALATIDTRNMLKSQSVINQKPYGTTWLNYVRCHDDIGLGFEDSNLQEIGFNPYLHRTYLKNYLGNILPESPSAGALFGVNPKTNDARISGTLASLCGLEKALENKDLEGQRLAIQKMILMQANSILLGGIPMLFYGDEVGYTNDYSYLNDSKKNYDNRWMHRPIIDWEKNAKSQKEGSVEHEIYTQLKTLIQIRINNVVFSDLNNVHWLESHNRSVVGFVRKLQEENIFCLFNYSPSQQGLTYYVFKELLDSNEEVVDLWSGDKITIGEDWEHLQFKPYQFYVLVNPES